MHDFPKAGDIITATVANEGKPSGAKWEVLGIGIEPSTDVPMPGFVP